MSRHVLRLPALLALLATACDGGDTTDAAACDDVLGACESSLDACEVDLAAALDAECEDCDQLLEDLACPTDVATPTEGGAAWSSDEVVSIHLPPGAVDENVTLTVALVPAAAADPELASAVYDIGPDDTTFAHKATVCFRGGDYDDLRRLCLAYYDEAKKGWKCEDDCLRPVGESTVCGETGHLTNFAILLDGKSGGKGCDNDYILSTTGGTASSDDGAAFVNVPPAALKEPTAIVVEPGTNPVAEAKLASDVFTFTPAGTEFAKPATVCMPATIAKAPEACLAYLDDSGGTPKWKCEDQCLESAGGDTWCGKTTHFTSFAILLGGGLAEDECAKVCK